LKHLSTLNDLGKDGIETVLRKAAIMKADPKAYSKVMDGRTLLMFFAKPSLRTRVSFETGMSKMGGHAIYYNLSTSPIGVGKESWADTSRVMSRYVDIIMARLYCHKELEELISFSDVPVINALTDYTHPCQILADLLTIREKKGSLEGLKLCYLGDSNNNVTHSLMLGCHLMGMEMTVGCPDHVDYSPQPGITDQTSATIHHDAFEAAANADILYADTWMSYHIEKDEATKRTNDLTPYQVNAAIMAVANPEAIFMNCLPAQRGMEQTAEVIDGPQSVVFDQAENRMWAQNAVMDFLLEQQA